MEFNLYYQASGGSTQWTEDRLNTNTQGVTIKNGYFSVYLGQYDTIPALDWSEDLYLGMTIRGNGSCVWGSCTPADAEMTPRFKLTAVPYAFRASNVASSNTNVASTNSDGVSITTGDALGATSNSGNISVDTGTATGTAGTISLGATNASQLLLGRAGLTTAVQGGLSVTEDTALNGNITLGSNSSDTILINAILQGTNALVFEGATADGFETTLSVQDPTADVTFRLPALAAGTYDFCTSSGNCLGTGDIIQNGNSYGTAVTIGTNDGYDLNFETNGTTRITVDDTTGNVSFTSLVTLNGGLTLSGDNFLMTDSYKDVSGKTGILVPMYIYPSSVYTNTDYNNLIAMKKKYKDVPMTVILNNGNGPGGAQDGNFTAAIKRLQGAGITVIGYIDTNFTAVSIADAKTDIDTWQSFYPGIDGIFYDRMTSTNTGGNVAYYAELTAYVHGKSLYPAIGNAGVAVAEAYFTDKTADQIVIHENSSYPVEATLQGDFAGGNSDYNYKNRAALVYGQSYSYSQIKMMRNYLGLIYVTDDVAANPWDTVPSYLESVMRALATDPEVTLDVLRVETSIESAGTLTVTGLTTLNGGLTVETGDNFTFNGDVFTDFTGGGLVNTGGVLSVDTTSATGFFRNGGNAFTANSTLGNTGNYDLNVMTNNLTRLTVQADGDLAVDTNTLFVDATNNFASIGSVSDLNAKLQVVNDVAADSVLLLRAAASQSAPLILAQDSTGAELLSLRAPDQYSVFLGNQAGSGTGVSANSVGIGRLALYQNTTGYGNSAIGYNAMQSSVDGYQNTSLGAQSLSTNVSGDNNVALGFNALGLSTGNNNIALGSGAGDNITTGSDNIIIGYNLDASAAGVSNELRIGGILQGSTSTLAAQFNGDLAVVGNTTLTGDLAVNGDDITSDGDLTITPAGGDTNITGNSTISGDLTVGYTAKPASSTFTITGQGDAGILLLGDSDNSNEDDNPYIRLRQDGTSNGSVIGMVGTAGTAPHDGSAYTGTTANALLLGTTSADALQLGTNGTVRLSVSSAGAVSITGTLAVDTLGTADTSTYLCRNSSNIISGCLVSPISSSLTDNIADAFDLQEGTNNYFNINTTNSSENISFGNATTNPSFNFIGSGTLAVAGAQTIAGNLTVDTNTLFVDATNNRVGIGTNTVTNGVLNVNGTAPSTVTGGGIFINTVLNSTTVNQSGIRSVPVVSPGSASTQAYYGLVATATSSSANISGGSLGGMYGGGYYGGTGNVGNMYGIYAGNELDTATGTAARSTSLFAADTYTAGGAITDNYGIYVETINAGTNDYGIYVQAADTYALFVDAGATRLDGTLAVNDATTITPTTNSAVALTVNGTSGTAATALAVVQTGAATAATISQSQNAAGLTVTANALTTANGLTVSSSSTGLTTGSLLSVTSATTSAVATNGIVSLNATGNYTSTSNAGLLNVTANSTTAGTVANIQANALTTGQALYLSSTNTTLTSGSLFYGTTATTSQIGAAGIYSFNASANFQQHIGGYGLFNVAGDSTTGGVLATFNAAALSTGYAVKITVPSLTTGYGLSVTSTGTGLTNGSVAQFSSGTTSAVATNGIVNLNATGNYTSTSNIGLLSVKANATTAGTIQNIQGNALTTGQALYVSSTGTGLTTGSLGYFTSATTGAVATNGIFSLNATGAYTSTSNAGLLNVTANSTSTGTIANFSGNVLSSGVGVNISSTGSAISGMTSGSLLRVTSATDGAVATNGIVSLNATGNYTSTSNTGFLDVKANATTTGTVINVQANALTTGQAIYVSSTSANLSNGSLFYGTTATTGSIGEGAYSFNATGNFNQNIGQIGIFNVAANATTGGIVASFKASALTTGNAVRIETSALTTGQALYVAATGTGLTSGSVAYFTSGTTGAVATNGIVSLNATGNYTSTSNAGLLNVTANSTTAGTVANIQGTALTTGTALNINAAAGIALNTVGRNILTGHTSGANTTLVVNNSTSTGSIFVAQDNGSAVFTIADGGAITSTSNMTLQGGTATLGTTSQAGSLVISDGSSSTITFISATQVAATNYNLTVPAITGSDTICLVTLSNCAGGANIFTDGGTFAYLTTTTDDLIVGGSSATTPTAKLAIVGDSNETQLIVRASASQTNANPLVLAQDSTGAELFRLNAQNNSSIFLGYHAGDSATYSGTDNIGLGTDALGVNTSGGSNIAIGTATLQSNTTGNNNVAIGSGAAQGTSADYNTAIGYGALNINTSGNTNTAIGSSALRQITTGWNNVGLGSSAGYGGSGSTSDGGTYIGESAGFAVMDAVNNTFIGRRSGVAVTNGDNNILLGYQAGDNITTGSNNIIIGYDLDASAVGVSNELRIGGILQGSTSTLAAQFNGVLAVVSDLTVDTDTLFVNATTNQVGIGTTSDLGAKLSVVGTSDQEQILIRSFSSQTDDNPQIVIQNSTGSTEYARIYADANNLFFGRNAGGTVKSGATNNAGFGSLVLQSLTSGDENVAFGTSALGSVSNGSGNIAIGLNAGDNITTGDNNIIIGYNLDASAAGVSNELRIGGILQGSTSTLAAQFNGATTILPTANSAVALTVNGTSGTAATALAVVQSGAASAFTATANGITTQTAASITSTSVLTTTGNLLTLTANSATTATGLLTVNGTSLTTGAGITVNVASSANAISAGGNITFQELTGTRTLGVQTRTTGVAGTALTVQAGAGGAGAGFVGGALTLQGGSAGGTTANGGNVNVAGGVGTGTGVKGLVVIDTATYLASTVQNFTANANITQTNIDSYGSILISGNTAGWIATLTDPTQTTTGRVVYITNSGSVDITLAANSVGVALSITLKPASTATMYWNGSDWTAAGASSSTDLQAAYNNTATSAGGAELVLNASGGAADGLTIRNNATTPITGGLLEVQSSIGSNLFSVNNNATEYATNGGGETAGASSSTFPASTWDTTTGGTVDRYTTTGDNVATGAASTRVQTTTTNHGARNRLSTTLTTGLTYTVSFAVRGATNFTTLDIRYSPDGTTTGTTQCATAQTVTAGAWTRITCSFVASGSITSSNSMLIRQTDATARTFYIDNLSVNVNASATFAADGSVDSALGTNWTAFGTLDALTRDTTTIYDTSGSVAVNTPNAVDRGVRNNMAITPSVSTQYLVTFYAKSTTAFSDIRVRYTRDGGTNFVSCTDYSTQTVSTSAFTEITCLFTTDSTTATDPDLIIDQPTGSDRIFYVDGLTVTINTNNSNNVQIGGGNKGGPVTLFTLDRSAGAPIAENNNAYLGSMYYDTTSGRIQCYEADGWGACGAAPDNIVNLNPEYSGAVLNGTGVGTMTADFCAEQAGVLNVNTTLCASGEAKNFYKWTSPQATQQTYSIYVTYQLPATFNGFSSDDTIQLTALTDSTTNAAVTYEVFKSTGSAVTQCGTGETTVVTIANTWQSVGINGNESTGCSFNSSSAGNFVIFKINMKANSNANSYVSTLSFVTTGR